MIMTGNIEPFYYDYFYKIKGRLTILIWKILSLKTNCKLENLCSLLKKSKVFFHQRYGEHFRMSIVEAMSAGLIPVVTDEGGRQNLFKKNINTIQ